MSFRAADEYNCKNGERKSKRQVVASDGSSERKMTWLLSGLHIWEQLQLLVL